jgi:hypothetical protein
MLLTPKETTVILKEILVIRKNLPFVSLVHMRTRDTGSLIGRKASLFQRTFDDSPDEDFWESIGIL